MRINAYQKNFDFQEKFWWFVGMRKVYSMILDKVDNPLPFKRVLDVGCGVGNNLNILQRYGTVIGIDNSSIPLEFCIKTGFNKCVQASAADLPFEDEVFSIVAALNILEHVENDEKIIQELKRVCRRGGTVLIITSAFPFLWGSHDEASHHKRRYKKDSLMQIIKKSDMSVERITYINIFIFHILAISRPFQRLFRKSRKRPEVEIQKLPKFINSLLIMLFSLESVIIKNHNLPYGSSLLCLARKN